MSLSPHPRRSGDGFLPQQLILRAAGLPSPQLSSVNFAPS